jgi:hypothetical protein
LSQERRERSRLSSKTRIPSNPTPLTICPNQHV